MAEHRCKTPLTSLVPYNDLQTAAPSHAAVWQRRIPRRHSLVDAAADGRKPSIGFAGHDRLHNHARRLLCHKSARTHDAPRTAHVRRADRSSGATNAQRHVQHSTPSTHRASQDSMRESSDHVAHDREPFDTDAMCIANHADSSQMHPPRCCARRWASHQGPPTGCNTACSSRRWSRGRPARKHRSRPPREQRPFISGSPQQPSAQAATLPSDA